ncbi:hypothetical protein [Actinokineospora enzanensis]|uniref:hypothetical protein n=1 Tax=Actinokineospora enzanensis TaxID=155975 RepID=UPI00036EC4F4|nr:hypothetical protein [Actinokineospora enzanensis]
MTDETQSVGFTPFALARNGAPLDALKAERDGLLGAGGGAAEAVLLTRMIAFMEATSLDRYTPTGHRDYDGE